MAGCRNIGGGESAVDVSQTTKMGPSCTSLFDLFCRCIPGVVPVLMVILNSPRNLISCQVMYATQFCFMRERMLSHYVSIMLIGDAKRLTVLVTSSLPNLPVTFSILLSLTVRRSPTWWIDRGSSDWRHQRDQGGGKT